MELGNGLADVYNGIFGKFSYGLKFIPLKKHEMKK